MKIKQSRLSNDESWLQLGNDASNSQSGHSTASHDEGQAPTPPPRHYTKSHFLKTMFDKANKTT